MVGLLPFPSLTGAVMATVLGIDGASTGAAALVEHCSSSVDPRLLGALRWGPVPGGWEVCWLEGERRIEARRAVVLALPMVGVAIASRLLSMRPSPSGLPDAIVIEEQYVGASPANGLRIARNTGNLEGGLIVSSAHWREAPPIIRRMAPKSWRTAIGLKHARDRDQAKQISLEEIPKLIPAIGTVMEHLGRWDDLCEACGLALAGLRNEAWSGSADDYLLRVESSTGAIRGMRAKRIVAAREKRSKR